MSHLQLAARSPLPTHAETATLRAPSRVILGQPLRPLLAHVAGLSADGESLCADHSHATTTRAPCWPPLLAIATLTTHMHETPSHLASTRHVHRTRPSLLVHASCAGTSARSSSRCPLSACPRECTRRAARCALPRSALWLARLPPAPPGHHASASRAPAATRHTTTQRSSSAYQTRCADRWSRARHAPETHSLSRANRAVAAAFSAPAQSVSSCPSASSSDPHCPSQLAVRRLLATPHDWQRPLTPIAARTGHLRS